MWCRLHVTAVLAVTAGLGARPAAGEVARD